MSFPTPKDLFRSTRGRAEAADFLGLPAPGSRAANANHRRHLQILAQQVLLVQVLKTSKSFHLQTFAMYKNVIILISKRFLKGKSSKQNRWLHSSPKKKTFRPNHQRLHRCLPPHFEPPPAKIRYENGQKLIFYNMSHHVFSWMLKRVAFCRISLLKVKAVEYGYKKSYWDIIWSTSYL